MLERLLDGPFKARPEDSELELDNPTGGTRGGELSGGWFSRLVEFMVSGGVGVSD